MIPCYHRKTRNAAKLGCHVRCVQFTQPPVASGGSSALLRAKERKEEFHADDADLHGSDPRESARSASSAWNYWYLDTESGNLRCVKASQSSPTRSSMSQRGRPEAGPICSRD